MKPFTKRLLAISVTASFASANAQTIHAGPWAGTGCWGSPAQAVPVGPPVPVGPQVPVNGRTALMPSVGYVPPSYAANAGSQLPVYSPPSYVAQYPSYASQYPAQATSQTLGYGNYAGAMPPTNNAPSLAPGFPQTVAGYLPTAAYDTQWSRTPVTYYRPVTAFDPRYGTTVTSLQPCTSYQYQAQRVPVIAPRPLQGDYGSQANNWPAITSPGYNPTGLAVSNAYAPVAQPIQNVPMVGMPMNGQPNVYATMGSSGTSLGMPATSPPTTTTNYNPQSPGLPIYPSQPNYNGSIVQNPGYATSLPAMNWSNQSVGSGVVPSAAWSPAGNACANGNCNPTASPMQTPYVPNATSVTPIGPPTYSSSPNNGSSQPAYGSGGQPYTPNILPPAGSPVLPPNQFFPPGMNPAAPGLADPESVRVPGLGSSAATSPASNPASNSASVAAKTPLDMGLPMAAIDPGAKPTNNNASNQVKPDFQAGGPRAGTLLQPGAAPTLDSSNIPPILPPRSYSGAQPLSAPDDYDSKPQWNPTLLDPEDRKAMEQVAQLRQTREEAARKIQLQADDSSPTTAIALSPSSSNRNVIQLVSGIENRKTETKEVGEPSFRPVSSLK